MRFLPSWHAFSIATITVALLASAQSFAQTTYRWVDPKTGTTVISDQPPPPGTQQVVKREADDSGAANQPMSYATRQASEKFPVTLYLHVNCDDFCIQARTLLNARGIPYSETILTVEEDKAELSKRLGSAAATPTLFVGRQSFKGFEAGGWNNLLDLAGYPKSAPYGAK
jgi:glutaredoxin